MATYTRETVAGILSEIKPLLQEHWKEVSTYQDLPLDPDYDAYAYAERLGKVRVYAARSEGVLVGYGVFFVGNLHYKSSRIATQDILFVLPEHRLGRVGFGLVRFINAQLKAEGVQVIYQHVKLAHPSLGRLLQHCDYQPVETIYARRF